MNIYKVEFPNRLDKYFKTRKSTIDYIIQNNYDFICSKLIEAEIKKMRIRQIAQIGVIKVHKIKLLD